MFQKASGGLSPTQALQLAATAAQFAGEGGNDAFEMMRKSLGVNSLDIQMRAGRFQRHYRHVHENDFAPLPRCSGCPKPALRLGGLWWRYERAQMKPIAASTAPTTASNTIIRMGHLGGAGGMSDIWLRAGRCWHAVDVSRILHHRAPHAAINDANALSHLNPGIWPRFRAAS
jgi:hypothetical protein